MRKSLKALVATAAFAVCMCATMIVSYADTDLKLDPVSLVAYAGEAATDEGASVPGSELFVGLDTGSYTFNDVSESLDDYALEYEVTDGDHGTVYLIGNAIELGTEGDFEDALAADATYKYYIVGEDYEDTIVSIALKNAGDVASVAIVEISDAVGDAPSNAFSSVVDVVTDTYSSIVDAAQEARDSGAFDGTEEFLNNAGEAIGNAVDDAVSAIQDAFADVDFDALFASFASLFGSADAE